MNINLEGNLKNYEILNTIVPKYYRKKFPYNIIPRAVGPNVELTHKKVELEYIKNKNYFVTADQAPKWKRGGIYGGGSRRVDVYFF